MISSVGQSPTEPWFSDGGTGVAKRPSAARPAPCRRPRFGVRRRCPTEEITPATPVPSHPDLRGGPGAWGQRPQITTPNHRSNKQNQNPPPQKG